MASAKNQLHAVIIGAYGFIGAACVAALKESGYRVTGVGRSRAAANASDPDIPWVLSDITELSPDEWKAILRDADIVLNASGALQDGLKDKLEEIHVEAVARIVEALQGTPTKLIQISAAGASEESGTGFMRTKAEGDAIVEASDLNWCILRPTLVLGDRAYGGTALLRASAAVPWVSVDVFPHSEMQVISVRELARSVVEVAEGVVPNRMIYELSADDVIPLAVLINEIRRWQGFALPQWRIVLPKLVVRILGWGADVCGLFGWRSPMRTNALKALQNGVRGDSSRWKKEGGAPFSPLRKILASIPSTTQERWFARLFLLLPFSIAVLAAFWIVSGIVGLTYSNVAGDILTMRGMDPRLAGAMVLGGALLDVVLGAAILFRPWARKAALAMIAVSVGYLIGATVWAPDLWADPLGPLVKVVPSMLPALYVAALLEER